MFKFRAHFAEMILVFNFAAVDGFKDADVHGGARLRKSELLFMDIIGSNDALTMQRLERFHDLRKTIIDLCECLINLRFHAVKYT